MVFNSTFNNISVISWWSTLLVETVADPIIKTGCVEIQLSRRGVLRSNYQDWVCWDPIIKTGCVEIQLSRRGVLRSNYQDGVCWDPIIKTGCVEIQLSRRGVLRSNYQDGVCWDPIKLSLSILMLVPIHNFDGQWQMSWYF